MARNAHDAGRPSADHRHPSTPGRSPATASTTPGEDQSARQSPRWDASPSVQLVPPLLRRRLWILIVPCVLTLGVLGWKLADLSTATAVDAAVDPRLAYHFRGQRQVFETIIVLGDPVNVALASAALAGLCLLVRAHRAALLSLTGPPLAGALVEWVLKPLVDRRYLGGLVFPSGHTAGTWAIAVVLVLLLLPGGALRNLAAPVRVLLWYASAVFSVGVGLGLVILRFHYITDVVGGAAVAVMVILASAWALDRRAGGPQRTPRGFYSR